MFCRRLQHEKEEWSRQLDTREKEVSSLKDNIQGLLHRITNLENKLNLTENEVSVSHLLRNDNILWALSATCVNCTEKLA